MKELLSLIILFSLMSPAVRADEPQQSYIDEIRKTLPPQKTESSGTNYTEKLREKLPDQPKGEYIDAVRKSMPTNVPSATSSEGYTEKQKAALEPKEDDESAIQKVKEGRSEVELKRSGKIHYAGGFRVGAVADRKFIASGSAAKRSFSEVYGTGWSPDLHLNFEFQPFHSEWLGNIGFFSDAGFSFFKGNGRFAVELPKPNGKGTYGNVSKTEFRFTEIPVTVGANYRLNLFRLFRPYVQAGYQVVGYAESRNDSKTGNKGYSTGVMFGGGVAFLMDWISTRSTAAYYTDFSIKHYYLVADYTNMKTISGDVDFSSSLLSLGFLFEL